MPRYELVEGTSSKFWQIEKAKGDTYKVSWGRIGSAGQTQLKKLTTAQHDKLVAEKTKKGYKLVGGKAAKAAKPGKAAPAAKPAAKPAASNKELEDALYEAIDDKERWLVYADWLQQQGDVRGEIIALMLAKKKAAAKKLLDAHAEALYGNAAYLLDENYFQTQTWTGNWRGAKPEPLDTTFACLLGPEGMIERVALSGLDEHGHCAKAMADVFAAPIGRFIRHLTIELTNDESYSGASGQPNADAVAAAIAKARPTALRSLSIGVSGYQLSWTFTGRLGPLLAATPHLETLSIDVGNIDLGKNLVLPRLTSLTLESGGLDRKNVLAIANAKWPALERLTLYFGSSDYGGNAKRADVAALLAGSYPKLKHLALCNAEIQPDIVQVIASSPIVKQLETLDLSKGTLLDEHVAPLVQNLAAFKKLKTLDLSENYLTTGFEKTLKKSLGKAYVGGMSRYEEMAEEVAQYGNEDWAKKHTFRYTVVGE